MAIGALLLGLVWASVVVVTGTNPPQYSSAPPSPAPAGGAGDTTTPRERCARSAQTLAGPVGAARPAMDQWSLHVGAMNQLVAGQITLDQANAFWNNTRIAAARHVNHFQRALDRARRAGVDCPAPNTLGASPALRTCSNDVAADQEVVRTARTALTTWDRHVADMERLRAGDLSPTRATQMWLSMWQRGDREIDRYQAAVGAARQLPACGAHAQGSGTGSGDDGGSGGGGSSMSGMSGMR